MRWLRAMALLAALAAVALTSWNVLSPDPTDSASTSSTPPEAAFPEAATASMESSSAADPDSDAGIVEYLGVPRGPFDPVLQRPTDPTRLVSSANKLVNDPTGEMDGQTQSEVSIAVAGDEIVVGWNDAEGFFTGEGISGFGYSTDRGETWVDGGPLPDGPQTRVFGDPTLVVTNAGTWVYGSLNRGTFSGVAVNRGTFSGGVLNWDPAEPYNDGGALDKEYFDYDPDLDRLYLAYIGFDGRLAYSDDEGQTWSTPVEVENQSGQGFYPTVGIDGEVYVTWVDPLGGAPASLYIRHSPDGGESWSGPRRLVHVTDPGSFAEPICFNRPFNIIFPSAAVDRSGGPYHGRVYFTYNDGTGGAYDAFVRWSDDKGVTWSDAVRVNDNDNAGSSEQFWPQVAVGPDGRVTIGFYDRRNADGTAGLADFYVAQSVDGGTTWTPNRRASDTSVAWCGVPSTASPNFGDYVETVVDDRSVFSVWSDAREGDPDVIFSRIDDVQTLATTGTLGGAGGGGGLSAEATAWFIPNVAEIAVSPAPAGAVEAELGVLATIFALLATPAEDIGPFQIGQDALSGTLSLSSSVGSVSGTYSLVRTGDNDIDLEFTADAESSLEGVEFEDAFTLTAILTNSTLMQMELDGTLFLVRTSGEALNLDVAATVNLDGGLGSERPTLTFTQEGTIRLDSDLFVRTRTRVEGVAAADVPDVSLGENPAPMAVLKMAPNPWEPATRLRLALSDDAVGDVTIHAIDGRLVRRLASGTFRAGEQFVEFDGRDDQGRLLPNGGYVVRLMADNVRAATKMLILR